jgi:adenine deaminase
MEEIIENGTIVFKNGSKKSYDVLSLTKTGVFTGHIKESTNYNKKFIDQGFIPKDQIQKILVLNKHSRWTEIDFEKTI